MGNMRIFNAYKRFADRTSEDSTYADVTFYVSELIDWYHDCRREAPKVPASDYVTLYDFFSHKAFRSVFHRGVSNYLREHGYFPNFRQATDFMAMNMLHGLVMAVPRENPSNKLNVGQYIPEALQSKIRPPKVHKVFDAPEEVTLDGLPPGSYFMKSNHGSKQNLHLDLREGTSHVNVDELRAKAEKWSAKPFGTSSCQWWYQAIDRKVFIEEDLRVDDFSEPLSDLRFHCINGKMAMLQYDVGLGTDHRENPLYDSDLNYMPYSMVRPNRREHELPKRALEARDFALEICKPFQYVRVDIYARGDELFMGELTYLPNAGRRPVRSKKLNAYLSAFWDPMPQVIATV